MPSKISITNLTVKYDNDVVINNLSYDFQEGSVTSIMGASGIGKTSLINSIMGLIPYEGEISINGPSRISAVFQEDRLLLDTTVYRNLHLVAPSLSKIELEKALNSIGLSGCIKKNVAALSGGMKRRIAILRALLTSSDIIIMDEPFIGLDNANKKIVMKYIQEKLPGRTMLIITHNKEEALFFNSQIFSF